MRSARRWPAAITDDSNDEFVFVVHESESGVNQTSSSRRTMKAMAVQ
jgi:hypothetical protein